MLTYTSALKMAYNAQYTGTTLTIYYLTDTMELGKLVVNPAGMIIDTIVKYKF